MDPGDSVSSMDNLHSMSGGSHGGSSSGSAEPPPVSGFLLKTFEIFSDAENFDICSWGPRGDTIVVKRIDDFSKYILPKHFKHSNFQSFVRQLNMYDFHKTVNDPANGEFQHTYFLEGRRDLLPLIKRKAHMKATTTTASGTTSTSGFSETKPPRSQGSGSKKASATASVSDYSLTSGPGLLPLPSLAALNAVPNTSLISESDGVLSEFVSHKVVKNDVERRLRQLERQSARIADLESKQTMLVSENELLNQMIHDMRRKQQRMQEKMEKILLMLYKVFSNASFMKVMSGENWQNSGSEASVVPPGLRITNLPENGFNEMVNFLQLEVPFGRRTTSTDDPSLSLIPLSSSLGSPIFRGNSFDVAASSVMPPYGPELTALPSFSSNAGDAASLGVPLARLNSLDPYFGSLMSPMASLPPSGTANPAAVATGALTTSSALEQVALPSTIDPLISLATVAAADASLSLKREREETTGPADSSADDSLSLKIARVDPVVQDISAAETPTFLKTLQSNQDATLRRMDSLETQLQNLIDDGRV